MEEGGLSINDVGKIIGSQSAASMIVNGKRAISKTQAKRLAERFRLDAGAFI
jgi:HTH-type transcriptional regulator/antitoxin HigA